MERKRLQNLALRKVKQEQKTKPIAPCVKCGNLYFKLTGLAYEVAA